MKRVLMLVALTCLAVLAADNAAVDRQSVVHGPSSIVEAVDAITIPQMLSYQGKLTDSLGRPVADTLYAMRYMLYDQPAGGTQFWEENQQVRTRGGLFSVLLGSVTPIDSVPDAGALYVGMAVEGGAELTPRLRIASAAYAYLSERAANADLLQGKDTVALDGRYVNEGQAAAGDLASTYPNPTIAQKGAGTGQVLKWTGAEWQPANDSVGQGGGTGDNAWARVGADSVLYTVHRLGIARGEADNLLYGNSRHTHINFGVGCTTGAAGQSFFYSTVGGGQGNIAAASYATVAGGRNCEAGGPYSGVLSGQQNRAGTAWAESAAVVCGGRENTAQAPYAAVGGGSQNTASGTYGTVAGGLENVVDGERSTIGGGYLNYVYGEDATVSGGAHNQANNDKSTVGGGYDNVAGGNYSVVCGGNGNTADASHAAVGGGWGNTGSGGYSTVAGGYANAAYDAYSTIGGGKDDTVRALYGGVLSGRGNVAGDLGGASDTGAVVCGGAGNRALARYAAVGGGNENIVDGYAWNSTIGGGLRNYAFAQLATVAGGEGNSAYAACGAIAGGSGNAVHGFYPAIGGGSNNIASGYVSYIGGGSNNLAYSRYTGVLCGLNNTAGSANEDTGAVVCGGRGNLAWNHCSFVGGGTYNRAESADAAVVGGVNNRAQGKSAFVGGGSENRAETSYATIAGGRFNAVTGYAATVAGGLDCEAGADYSFATGFASIADSSHENSAAFNGQTTTAQEQLRCDDLRSNSMGLALDHPMDPKGTILNLAAVSSPELLVCLRGTALIGPDGVAAVPLPDYFAVLCRNPMVQLTGVGTGDVWVADDIVGGRFSIGGRPGMKVYWVVTGERDDQIAQTSRAATPVEQAKVGRLAGKLIADANRVERPVTIDEVGRAARPRPSIDAGGQRHEKMRPVIEWR